MSLSYSYLYWFFPFYFDNLLTLIQIMPFPIYKVFIIFYFLLVEILVIGINCSDTIGEVISFSNNNSQARRRYSRKAYQFTIQIIAALDLIPLGRNHILKVWVMSEQRSA